MKKSKQIFIDSPQMANDPRSVFYKRQNNRPKINLSIVILNIVLAVAFSLFSAVITYFVFTSYGIAKPDKAAKVAYYAAMCLIIILNLKRFVICSVRIYQRIAPESLRNSCRFEPSCSNYMIMAVEKYGAVKGTFKGICRCARCTPNSGGYDFP